jgi:hypothetical protein
VALSKEVPNEDRIRYDEAAHLLQPVRHTTASCADDAGTRCGSDSRRLRPRLKEVVGIITDRDLCITGIAEGKDPYATTIGSYFTPEVLMCSPS